MFSLRSSGKCTKPKSGATLMLPFGEMAAPNANFCMLMTWLTAVFSLWIITIVPISSTSAASEVDDIGTIVMIHKENTAVSHVINIQKFAFGAAISPNGNMSVAPLFGFVHFPDERRENMRIN